MVYTMGYNGSEEDKLREGVHSYVRVKPLFCDTELLR